ncbi:hypothetical protein BsWGS_00542 [Bradybaena similaris]
MPPKLFSKSKPSKGKIVETELPPKKYGAKPELTETQKLDLSKAFGIFDPRGSGLIEQRGFMLVLRALGMEPTFGEVDELISTITGRAFNETLDFKDFYNLMNFVMTRDDSKDDIMKAFKIFSSDRGVIVLDDLVAVAEQLGEDISREKLQEMIHFADKKSDGTVTYKEFAVMMERPQLE